ncbi:MAG TPA: glycosyltransferase family 39 protein [Candidatus Deferrimicrobiaceae bacterium]|jgi:hypothetical protein
MNPVFAKERALWLIALALAAVTAAAYSPVLGNGFILFDDPEYLTRNAHVLGGITADSLRWAFTGFDASNWHPLTWLSHMLDVRLFGLDPSMHHAVNLLFHIANVVLVFLVFRKMTGRDRESAAASVLFALHPLHVESVAWVSERKDVLSTFFLLATLGAYARYTERPGAGRYLLALGFLALGLLVKPMLVTLPFLLLLADAWPLGRPLTPRVFLEKIPSFALSAGSCVMKYLAQAHPRTYAALVFPAGMRLANAVVAYARYLGKTLYPGTMSILYPYPASIPAWEFAASLGLLSVLTFAVLRARHRFPYLAFG